jgi:hypothetical protein
MRLNRFDIARKMFKNTMIVEDWNTPTWWALCILEFKRKGDLPEGTYASMMKTALHYPPSHKSTWTK